MREYYFFCFALTSLVAVVLCQNTLTDSEEVVNLLPVRKSVCNDKRQIDVMSDLYELSTRSKWQDEPRPPLVELINSWSDYRSGLSARQPPIPVKNRMVTARTEAPLEDLEAAKRNVTNCLDSTTTSRQRSRAQRNIDTKNIRGTCGFSNPGANFIESRFGQSATENDYAAFGEFPWMVAVLKRSTSEDWIQANYLGGGSLIHPMVVVTVAHLIRDPKRKIHLEANEIKVRAGEWETISEDELFDHQERNVAKVVVHEHYFRVSLYNDIGLLFLETPVALEKTPHIGIGCLASQLPSPGTICYSMGWGVQDFTNKKVYSSKLKKIKLPLLGKEECNENMRKTRFGNIFRLHQSLVCAGGEEGIGNCRGDRGSSLVCPIVPGGSRYAIYGLYAYTLGCGVQDVPGVYVNVPNLFQWVGQQLALEGLNSESYTFM